MAANNGNTLWLKKLLGLLKTALSGKASTTSVTSLGQQVSGLTTGLNSKLEKDGSNATTTTTNNIIDKASNGGISISSLDSEKTNIVTKKDGENVKKFSLGTIVAWLIDYFNQQKIQLKLGNVLVYQGASEARSVAPQDYVDQQDASLLEKINKKANATALNSLGTRVTNLESEKASLKDVANFTNATSYNGFLGVPMTICWNGGTSVAASTLFGYGTDYADNGRILVFANGTDGSVSVTGLTDGSYSVAKGRCLQMVKWGTLYFPMNDKT